MPSAGEGTVPTLCSTGTQTSRPVSPLFPLLSINENQPLDTSRDTSREISTNQKLKLHSLPSLQLKQRLTNSESTDSQLNEGFLYSEEFSNFYASARALKRKKRRLGKLSGSLPSLDLNGTEALAADMPVSVVHLKEGAAVGPAPVRRQHTIAELNNMRNKFTLNRYHTSDQIQLNGTKESQDNRKKSAVSTGSQTLGTSRPLSVSGRNPDTSLEGLLRSDSFKTLDSARSKNYQFQRSKTTLSSATEKENKSTNVFLTSNEEQHDEKPSIYKLSNGHAASAQTPHHSMEALTHHTLLSPGGDSDRMRTPDLNTYVQGHHVNASGNGLDNSSHINGFANGHSNLDKSKNGAPVIHDYRRGSKHKPKMVLKYYGSEMAVKGGVIPSRTLPDNTQHIRSIMTSPGKNNTKSDSLQGRKVSFKEKQRKQREHDFDKRLATTSITMSANDAIIPAANSRPPVALTTKNLAIFDDFHDHKIKPINLHSNHTRPQAPVLDGSTEVEPDERVLEWVKANRQSNKKVPQILPIKQVKHHHKVNITLEGVKENGSAQIESTISHPTTDS